MEKKEKEYDYFISFYWSKKSGEQGWGNNHLISNQKITNFGIIRQMADKLAENEGLDEVVITNFVLMEE